MEKRTAEKRVVKSESGSAAEIRSLILTAVLLAAGTVLKFFAGSVINIGGMKPNFIIAMYCLAILLIRPSLPRAAVETLAAYVPIVLCTALINCVIVGVLYVPARAALRA